MQYIYYYLIINMLHRVLIKCQYVFQKAKIQKNVNVTKKYDAHSQQIDSIKRYKDILLAAAKDKNY